MTTYDEDILDNPFYQALSENFTELYDVATNSGWMVCIPRLGSAARLSFTRKDFENHLLVPSTENEEEGKRQFVTPNAKKVVIEGDVIKTGNGFDTGRSVRILFQETNYGSRDSKYIVLCIDQPLEGELSEEVKVANLLSAEDCTKFLFSDSARTQKQVDKLLKLVHTSLTIIDGDSMRNIVDAVRATVTRTMQTVLKDSAMRKLSRQNQSYMSNVKLAVETYVIESLHAKIFPASCAMAAKDDAALNKKTRNLSETRPENLGLQEDHCAGIPKARRELSSLNRFTTPLDKIFCLRRVILALSSPSAGQEGVTADDLLPLLILLLIRADMANWKGNMLYITHFMSSAGSGEFVFVLSSFEAAVEHVMNDQVNSDQLVTPNAKYLRQKSDSSSTQSVIDVFFEHVKQNNIDTITLLLTAKLEVSNTVLEKMCHPLCSCEKCEQLLSGISGSSSAGDPMAVAANSRDDLGRTALHIAAEQGHGQMVELLLDCGAVASSTDYHSSTALHLACRRGHLAVVTVLLMRLDDVHSQDNDGNTILHLSSANGHEEVARALFTLRKEIDCNIPNERGDTALHLAARWGYEAIVRLLIEQKATPNVANRHKETPSQCTHNQRIIKLLEDEVHRRTEEESYILVKSQEIATHGESSAADGTTTRIEDRAHPVADETLPLSGANTPDAGTSPPQQRRKASSPSVQRIRKGSAVSGASAESARKKSQGSRQSLSAASSLPPQKANPLTGSVSQLQKEVDHLLKLCSDGDVQMVRYKLGFNDETAGKHVASYEESDLCHPLCDCDSCQNIRMRGTVAHLSPESCNQEGMASLHVASLHGRRHVVQLLLRHGAMVNCKNNAKQTPLHLACQYNHQDIVMLLVDYNAKVSPADLNGRTPLHNCCANGHDASAAILLFHGGDVNAPDCRGNTPLHQASKWGHGTLVTTLLLHGASPFWKNSSQQKPIHLSQDEDVRAILRRAENGEIPIGSHRRRNSLGDHATADEAMHSRTSSTSVASSVTAVRSNPGTPLSPSASGRDRTSSLHSDNPLQADPVREANRTVSRDPVALISSPSRSPRSGGRRTVSQSSKTPSVPGAADMTTTVESASTSKSTTAIQSPLFSPPQPPLSHISETASILKPTSNASTQDVAAANQESQGSFVFPQPTATADSGQVAKTAPTGEKAALPSTLNLSPTSPLVAKSTSSSSPRLAPRPASSRRLEELLNAIEDRSLVQLRTLSSLSSDVKSFNRRETLRRSDTDDRSGPSAASIHQYSITHFKSSSLRRVSTRDYSQPEVKSLQEDVTPNDVVSEEELTEQQLTSAMVSEAVSKDPSTSATAPQE